MSKYLYGASVQGIQSYIFETNRLKEIIGASEIVEWICTELFKDFIDVNKVDVILSAAGNIKIKVDSIDKIRELVRKFPKTVMESAPGITISQAVIKCNGNESEDIAELEKKIKEQKNKQIRPIEITAIGIDRSRRTGKSAVEVDNIKKEKTGIGTKKKLNYSKRNALIKKLKDNALEENFSTEMVDLTNKKCTLLAVIHVDGNSLGKIIQRLKTITIKEFSEQLNKITIDAAKTAFSTVIENKKNADIYPIRPIIIGGDDLTVICRADLAIEFTKIYLESFEKNGKNFGLTASAGISFIKESYPFHYAVQLAEELCSVSKKRSREKSSISFHKIQSTFMDSYGEIKDRELTAGGINLVKSPYFLDEIENLQFMVNVINEKDAPKSGIREWLSELSKNKESANQLMKRIISITNLHHNKKEYTEKLKLNNVIEKDTTHLYDVLTVASLMPGE